MECCSPSPKGGDEEFMKTKEAYLDFISILKKIISKDCIKLTGSFHLYLEGKIPVEWFISRDIDIFLDTYTRYTKLELISKMEEIKKFIDENPEMELENAHYNISNDLMCISFTFRGINFEIVHKQAHNSG